MTQTTTPGWTGAPPCRSRLLLPLVLLQIECAVLVAVGGRAVAHRRLGLLVAAPSAAFLSAPAGIGPASAGLAFGVLGIATAVGTINRRPGRRDGGGLHWSWYSGCVLAVVPVLILAAAQAVVPVREGLWLACAAVTALQLLLLLAPRGSARRPPAAPTIPCRCASLREGGAVTGAVTGAESRACHRAVGRMAGADRPARVGRTTLSGRHAGVDDGRVRTHSGADFVTAGVQRGPRAPVVAGIDGSGPAVRAAAWAAEEAHLRGRPLNVVLVLDDHRPIVRTTAEQALWRAETVARLGRSGVEVHAEMLHGNPAATLARLSASAELLVIGHSGAGGLDVVVGSTATALVSAARSPVVVVRPAPGRPVPDRDRPIVVGVDTDADSRAALEFAVPLADTRGSGLLAVHAYGEHLAGIVGRLRCRATEPAREAAVRLLAETLAGHCERHPDLQVRAEPVRGRSPAALLELSDSAQMIVVGRGGRRKGWRMGPSTAGLLRASSCPVAVVGTDP